MHGRIGNDARDDTVARVLDALGDKSLPAAIELRGAVIVAHPDDEIICAGARLTRWADVMIIHVTDGAPRDMHDAHALGLRTRDAYAALRRAERRAALELAGIGASSVRDLDLVDQEASDDLVELTARVLECMELDAPDVVITHPYEGGHPDHDATAFAVHAAVELMRQRGRRAPVVVEGTSYHLGAGGIVTGAFLPDRARAVCHTVLDPLTAQRKSRMLARHVTQSATLRQFRSEAEPIRLAPDYDFTRAPHDGALFYEQFPWRIDGVEWRERARDACRALGVRATRAAA